MEAVTQLPWLFDALLGFGLLWLAWRALACADLFEAIVSFVAFSLLMAMAWVRLDAPDVALAEAAIGAGLTGALLLAALARLRSSETNEDVAGQLGTEADLKSAVRGGCRWSCCYRLRPDSDMRFGLCRLMPRD